MSSKTASFSKYAEHFLTEAKEVGLTGYPLALVFIAAYPLYFALSKTREAGN